MNDRGYALDGHAEHGGKRRCGCLLPSVEAFADDDYLVSGEVALPGGQFLDSKSGIVRHIFTLRSSAG